VILRSPNSWDRVDSVLSFGIVLILVGIGLWSWIAALIATGVVLCGLAVAAHASRPRGS